MQNNRIKVLIADDNIEYGELLKEYINRHEDVCVIGLAEDGIQAISKIEELEPDVVILDIVMPKLDGIGVLEKIQSDNLIKKPQFIVLTAIGQDMFVQNAVRLGAEYYIVKPFDADVLLSRIRQIYKEKRSSLFSYRSITESKGKNRSEKQVREISIEGAVTEIMLNLGVPPHIAGYQYTREAIIQIINNSKGANSLSRVIYPAVAEKYNTTPQKVERSIRNAIDNAWERLQNKPHTEALDIFKKKPTNLEFISAIADRVRINSRKKVR